MAREDLGDLLPHARDAQGVDETLELALSRTLNAFEYVLRGLLRHALEAREGLDLLAGKSRSEGHTPGLQPRPHLLSPLRLSNKNTAPPPTRSPERARHPTAA